MQQWLAADTSGLDAALKTPNSSCAHGSTVQLSYGHFQHFLTVDLTISDWLQGQVTCTSGSSVFTADASELDAALKGFQAGECKELNISSTSLIQCGGTLYERQAFLDALVRRILSEEIQVLP